MLRNIKIFLILVVTINFIGCSTVDEKVTGTTYYFDAKNGDNNNLGTSNEHPFKSLSKIKDLSLKAGDSILLKANHTFTHPLELIGISGYDDKKIVVSTYPKNSNSAKAKINTKEFLNAVLIRNSSFIEINNIAVSALPSINQKKSLQKEMRCGILVDITEAKNQQNISIKNCIVENVFYEKEGLVRSLKETKSANGTQSYGWGIRFINQVKSATLKNLKIDSCIIKNVAHTGVKFTGHTKDYGIQNIVVSNTNVLETGGPGIQMSCIKEGHIFNNEVDKSGSSNDTRKWGRGSGLWTWGSTNILIEKNRFTNANGPGDSAGAHIDYNCKNVVLQYNFSANNAGGFCEILGNNYNCAYRYNISVNDGFRVKGKQNAFQEGKIFWLSAYSGKRKRIGAVNSYFYNNTIYVKKEIDAKIAIDRLSNGILIANNIFHMEGNTKVVKGDQYNPETNGKWNVKNVLFTNNIFLHKNSWPTSQKLQDESPSFGDVNFIKKGGLQPLDYEPRNNKIIQNKGIKISKLANDTIGLIYGLKVNTDILGNPIQGLPDIGAIELK